MSFSVPKKFIAAVLISVSVLFAMPVFASDAEAVSIEDAFSPHQGATALVVRTIGEAQKSIRVAAYGFTSKPIAQALIVAHRRGVEVRVVLDRRANEGRGLANGLRREGVPVRLNGHYAILHDKFMIIDGDVLELGSFNYTKSAEDRNAENVLVLHGAPQIIADYARQWERLWGEGESVAAEN